MSLHRGKVTDRGCQCSIDTRVERGNYHALVRCGNRSKHYEGPTNGAGVQAIAIAVVKDFVSRIKAPTLTPAKARQILHDRGSLASKRPLTAAARGYMAAVAKGGRKPNHWLLPLAVGVPAGAIVGAAAMHRSMKGARKANAGFVSAYSVAAGKGYPYIRGDGESRGGVWYGRFTKTGDGNGPALYVGYDEKRKKWVTFQGNAGGAKPKPRREVRDVYGRTHVTEVGRSLGVGKDFYVTVIDGGRTGFLLGPYPSHGQALAAVALGKRMAESVNDRAIWYAYGTSSAPHGTRIKTVFTFAEAKAFTGKKGNPLAKPEAAYLMRWAKAHCSKGGQDYRAGLPVSVGVEFGQATGLASAVGIYGASAESRKKGAREGRKASIGALRAMGSIGSQVRGNSGTARCSSCGYDVPRTNPGGALARHRNPRTRVECNGLVAVEKYHGRGTAVMVRGAVATGSCRRCNGARCVKLGKNTILCPTCCRKSSATPRSAAKKSSVPRRNNFASHKPGCKCIRCSGAIYRKKGALA